MEIYTHQVEESLLEVGFPHSSTRIAEKQALNLRGKGLKEKTELVSRTTCPPEKP